MNIQKVNENKEKLLQYDKNRKELKRLNKLYSVCFWIILIWTFCIVVFSLLDSVKAIFRGDSLIIHVFGGIIFPIAFFLCNTMASTNKSKFLTIIAPIFPSVGLIIGMGANSAEYESITAISFCMAPVSLLICGVMLYAHRRYEWLSQQEGFPHFQQLLEEQLQKSRDIKDNNPYIKSYEEYKKNVPENNMDEIIASTDEIEHKKLDKNNYMDEL